MECQICYGKSSKNVECTHCSEKCCKKCFNIYILGNESNNCMFCGEPQMKIFVRYNIMKKNIPAFKAREAEKLVKQEKALLSDTRVQLQLEQTEEDVQFLVNGLHSLLKTRSNDNRASRKTFMIFRATVDESIKRVRMQLHDLNGDNDYLLKLKSSGRAILCSFPCPVSGCNGIVLRTKCDICGVTSCSKCREISDDGHVCDNKNVATVAIIKQETKPCPTCKVAIYKIAGCDQMFCTNCKSGFSWRNGKILNTSILHNPHYFEWMQNHRNVNIYEHGCENRDWVFITSKLRMLSRISHCYDGKIRDINRVLGEVFEYFNTYVNIDESKRRQLRVKFIKNEIDENTWIKSLKRHITKMEKDDVIYAILSTFRDVMVDIILATNSTKKELPTFIDKCSEITRFTLGQFHKEIVENLALTIPLKFQTLLSDLL